MTNRIVEVNQVSVYFGENKVLDQVDFHLEKGDFLGIIGPNGGGKTTLLKVILGLLKPQEGDVRLFGRPPVKARKFMGYVPQHTAFDPKFPISVWDVVLMGRLGKLGVRPFYSSSDKDKAKNALKMVEMHDFRDQHISRLSGGQQQRVLIARALATEPKILLLDEPTASVDQKVKKSLYSLLNKLNSNGITIILVSHDIGVISSYVEKVACLNKRFIYHGTGELTTEMLEETYECPIDLITHGHPHRVFKWEMEED